MTVRPGWITANLRELIVEGPSNGFSPPSGQDARGTLTLKLSATTSGRFVLNETTTKRIHETIAPESKLWLRPGDILIQRANTLEYVGTTALFDGPPATYVYPDLMMRIRASAAVEPSYLCAFLNSPETRKALRAKATGTAGNMPKINGDAVRSMLVDLPSLNEQRRIVAKLEALQTRSRHVREAFARIDELDEELVHAWTRNGYPISTLEAHVIQKTSEVGNRWRDYPLVGLSNEGRITERREAIGQKTAHKCRLVEKGDIVFNPIRFSIGSIARYRGASPAIVSPEYQVISTRPTLSAELLVRYLRSRLGKSTLENETTGSVRYRVYFKDLQRIEVPLAPPEVQAKAERMLAYLARLREDSRALQRDLATLDRAVLTRTFRGELVPQDPNDEPAEAMLARLRNENSPPSSRENASGAGIPRAHLRKAI